ncbi:MAG: response regulator, partial [Agathobaculum sp.]|nr:response regulator [Agathobaculum sp.]
SVQRDSFSQDVLDHTLFRQTAPAPSAAPPKGLQSQTLARIEAYLRAAPDERHTSDEIASHVGLSVVTVRRYMNYLTDRRIIGSEMDYRTGGRPCLVYFLRQ